MARIRARFKLNKGRRGIAPEKLVRQIKKLSEIVQSLSRDLQLGGVGGWLVSDFQNASVDALWEHQEIANDRSALQWNTALTYIASKANDSIDAIKPEYVSDRSIRLVAEFGDELDSGEPFVVGLFLSDDAPADSPSWLESEALGIKSLAADVIALVEYEGCISGTPYEIAMGAERPFFKVREVTTRELVKCFYPVKLHSDVYGAMKDKDGLVYVYGSIEQNQLTGLFDNVKVRSIERAPSFSPADFEKFLGSAPTFSGKLNSETYVAKIRGHG